MMEDAVLFSGLSFCQAYATVADAAYLAITMDADAVTTAVSGLSYCFFAAADADLTASAANSHQKGHPLGCPFLLFWVVFFILFVFIIIFIYFLCRFLFVLLL